MAAPVIRLACGGPPRRGKQPGHGWQISRHPEPLPAYLLTTQEPAWNSCRVALPPTLLALRHLLPMPGQVISVPEKYFPGWGEDRTESGVSFILRAVSGYMGHHEWM